MLTILDASTPSRAVIAADLMREFVGWLRERFVDDQAPIKARFETAEFEQELNELHETYSGDGAILLLAMWSNIPAGCVGLRDLGNGICEVKRLFVRPGFQGKRIGRSLMERLIDEATETGFHTMRLDTSFRQIEALNLYTSMGFKRIPAYFDAEEGLKDQLAYFELDLTGGAGQLLAA